MPPARILLIRPDTYGDLFLFEPVPRILRHAWPESEIAVLIQNAYRDVVPIIGVEGVRWLTTACNPYRESPGDHPDRLAALRETVQGFAPDCVVAACVEHTWLEAAVAAFLPEVRQVAVGDFQLAPAVRAALKAVVPLDWQAIYPERILLDETLPEWEKNLRLAGSLLGGEAPRWRPTARIPEEARERARQIVTDAGLAENGFVACAAAGTANVRIKAWPAAHYGETLAWLETVHGVRALLIGHAAERDLLEAVRRTARAHGGDPAVWCGNDGEMPVVAALLEKARFYFGNDTGALHLAAALGRPVVSIFGGGHWPRFRPVAARELSIVQPLPCFGCAWDCAYADAPCVQTISTVSTQRALGLFLATNAPEQTVFEAEGLSGDARRLVNAATPRLQFLREDGKARLRQVAELSSLVGSSESDRAARLRQVEELSALLTTAEADRSARARQIEELSALLTTSEADRAARLQQVEELTALLAVSEADRAARLVNIENLTELLHTAQQANGYSNAALAPAASAHEQWRRAPIDGTPPRDFGTPHAPSPREAMDTHERSAEHPVPDANQTALGELRDRLWNARTQEIAARTEARRLARELRLARRLLRLQLRPSSPRQPANAPGAGAATVLLSEKLLYHLDARENLGMHTAVSGWAFRPARGWNARATRVTLLLRHDDTVYMTACREVRRPDVAAFYAGQPPGASGGAAGLDGAGFACEVRHDALPAGTEWKISLRLECGGVACEQFTGEFLKL